MQEQFSELHITLECKDEDLWVKYEAPTDNSIKREKIFFVWKILLVMSYHFLAHKHSGIWQESV